MTNKQITIRVNDKELEMIDFLKSMDKDSMASTSSVFRSSLSIAFESEKSKQSA